MKPREQFRRANARSPLRDKDPSGDEIIRRYKERRMAMQVQSRKTRKRESRQERTAKGPLDFSCWPQRGWPPPHHVPGPPWPLAEIHSWDSRRNMYTLYSLIDFR